KSVKGGFIAKPGEVKFTQGIKPRVGHLLIGSAGANKAGSVELAFAPRLPRDALLLCGERQQLVVELAQNGEALLHGGVSGCGFQTDALAESIGFPLAAFMQRGGFLNSSFVPVPER